jgi:DNA polymerase III sliding clamp (beta) subunit (PCNA family)
MEIKIRKELFESAITKTACALGDKKAPPMTQNFGIEVTSEGISVTASRTDSSARFEIPKSDDLEIISEGKAVVSGESFIKGISNFHAGVLVHVKEEENDEGDKKQISCSYSTRGGKEWDHEFALMDDQLFPEANFEWKSKHSVSYPADKFIEYVEKTAFAASDEESQRNYSVILMRFADEGLSFFATDGRQLSHVHDSSVSFDNEKEALLDVRMITSIAKKNILDSNFDVSISVEDKKKGSKIRIEQEGFVVISNFAEDAKRIPYDKVINMTGDICKFKVRAIDLKEDLKALFSPEFKDSQWSFSKDSIDVKNLGASAKRAGGQIEGVTDFEGDNCEMAFSLRYWENLLARTSGNAELGINVRNQRAAIEIEVNPAPDMYNFYIMPITAMDG